MTTTGIIMYMISLNSDDNEITEEKESVCNLQKSIGRLHEPAVENKETDRENHNDAFFYRNKESVASTKPYQIS